MIRSSFVVLIVTALCGYVAAGAQERQCGPNEARYPCGKECEERCNAPVRPSCRGKRCQPPFDCRCKNGYVRDPDSNHCIKKANCPVSGCAVGEFRGACGKTCEGTCASPQTPEICARIRCSEWSCRCDLDGGYVRSRDGRCVRIEDCKQ